MAKKRKSPSELVNGTHNSKRPWMDSLSASDRAYVKEVVAAMKALPGAPVYSVASELKKELGLSTGRDVIARTLIRLAND